MTDEIVPGVPARLRRTQLNRVIESLGFDRADLVSVEIGPNAVHATVMARHPETGHKFLAGNEPAVHRLSIPITEGLV